MERYSGWVYKISKTKCRARGFSMRSCNSTITSRSVFSPGFFFFTTLHSKSQKIPREASQPTEPGMCGVREGWFIVGGCQRWSYRRIIFSPRQWLEAWKTTGELLQRKKWIQAIKVILIAKNFILEKVVLRNSGVITQTCWLLSHHLAIGPEKIQVTLCKKERIPHSPHENLKQFDEDWLLRILNSDQFCVNLRVTPNATIK